MSYTLNLGVPVGAAPPRSGKSAGQFRLAILGDFSARASRGELQTGDELAARKPLRVDVDNLDQILGRMKLNLQLPLAADGGNVEVEIGEMDDFHPDQLYANVEIFQSLASLRQRLKNTATFAKAAQEVQSWAGVEDDGPPPAPARGSVVPVNGKLSDFAALVGRPSAPTAEMPINELLKRIVGPHVVAQKDPKQDKLLAVVDAALTEAMNRLLHHPDFQAVEALWRSVDMLVRRIETDANMQIVLYDISAEEFAADLSSSDNLEETGLFKLLVEQPSADAQQGPLATIIGNYVFEQTPPHAEVLGRMAKIAAAAQAPFISAIGPACLKKVAPEDVHPLVTESWEALRSLPESAYLALATPRFMLRNPYGERTDSIERFKYEEFSLQSGLRGMLWGNPAILAGLLLAQTCMKQGLKKMNLGSILQVDDLPFYFYEDADGDQVALPCTERLVTTAVAQLASSQNLIPVLSIKGKPEVRLGGFSSLLGKTLAGPWAPVAITSTGATAAAPATPAAAASAAPANESSPKPEPAPPASKPAEAPAAEVAPTEASIDSELDALLADLGSASEPAPADDSGMDADLAALLADL